jgi:hypothetical protein
MGANLKNTYVASITQINPAIIFAYPIGCIGAWLKNLTGTPALTPEWVECNGQTISDAASPYDGVTLPDLNTTNRFLRGNATSGGTGGQETFTTTTPAPHSKIAADTVGDTYSLAVHHHDVTTLPPYYNVVWILRIK